VALALSLLGLSSVPRNNPRIPNLPAARVRLNLNAIVLDSQRTRFSRAGICDGTKLAVSSAVTSYQRTSGQPRPWIQAHCCHNESRGRRSRSRVDAWKTCVAVEKMHRIRKDSAMTPARRYLPALATLLLAFLVLSFLPPVAFATCTAPKNVVEAEDCLPGLPASQWYVDGASSANIQGFTTDISVNTGQTIFFKISTSAVSYRIDIYRRTHGRNSISATYWLVLLATSRSSSPLSERTLRAPGIRSRLTTSSNRIERYGEDAASLRMWKCQERTSRAESCFVPSVTDGDNQSGEQR